MPSALHLEDDRDERESLAGSEAGRHDYFSAKELLILHSICRFVLCTVLLYLKVSFFIIIFECLVSSYILLKGRFLKFLLGKIC